MTQSWWEKILFGHAVGRWIGRGFVRRHNTIQFFGYEVANIVLAVSQTWRAGQAGYGLNAETCAALFFLLGSYLIYRFGFETRPSMLFYGGLSLTLGGLSLCAAGYWITGLSSALASVETMRGGLGALAQHQQAFGVKTRVFDNQTALWGQRLMAPYQAVFTALAKVFPRFGRFLDDRPFITGTIIKGPTRFEFVIKKALEGDWIGAFVGLSWAVLGDGALAFNDAKLRQAVAMRVGLTV
jgi:hypothetical protein